MPEGIAQWSRYCSPVCRQDDLSGSPPRVAGFQLYARRRRRHRSNATSLSLGAALPCYVRTNLKWRISPPASLLIWQPRGVHLLWRTMRRPNGSTVRNIGHRDRARRATVQPYAHRRTQQEPAAAAVPRYLRQRLFPLEPHGFVNGAAVAVAAGRIEEGRRLLESARILHGSSVFFRRQEAVRFLSGDLGGLPISSTLTIWTVRPARGTHKSGAVRGRLGESVLPPGTLIVPSCWIRTMLITLSLPRDLANHRPTSSSKLPETALDHSVDTIVLEQLAADASIAMGKHDDARAWLRGRTPIVGSARETA